MKSTLALGAFALALAAPATSWSQPQRPSPSQEFTFGDQLVQSQLPRPDDATVRPRRSRSGPTLLRIRENFVPELLKSVERL